MIKKLLIYNSGGGIGDSIQLFPLIKSLENLFEKSEIYYLGAHENHYLGKLKEYNIKVKTLNLGLKYFGFRWWHLFVAKRNFLKRIFLVTLALGVLSITKCIFLVIIILVPSARLELALPIGQGF